MMTICVIKLTLRSVNYDFEVQRPFKGRVKKCYWSRLFRFQGDEYEESGNSVQRIITLL